VIVTRLEDKEGEGGHEDDQINDQRTYRLIGLREEHHDGTQTEEPRKRLVHKPHPGKGLLDGLAGRDGCSLGRLWNILKR